MSVILGHKDVFLFDMKCLPGFLCALTVWKSRRLPVAICLFVNTIQFSFAGIPRGREFAILPKALGRCTGYRRPPREPELTPLEEISSVSPRSLESNRLRKHDISHIAGPASRHS